jgi:hypothetical protein
MDVAMMVENNIHLPVVLFKDIPDIDPLVQVCNHQFCSTDLAEVN